MASDSIRRVYELDVKLGAEAVAAVRAMQGAMKSLEDTAKASAKSLEGLNDTVGAGQDKAARFIKNLKDQIATLGLSNDAILRYQAAQLGITDSTDQLITTFTKKQALLKADADASLRAARAEADGIAIIKAHEAAGAALVSGLVQEVAAFGKTGDSLVRYKAGLLGVLEPVDRLLVKLNELKTEQQQLADAAAKTASEEARAASDKQRLSDSADRLVASLKRELDTFGQDALAVKQYDAALIGASKDVDPLIAKIRDLQAAQEKETKAARDEARAQDEASAALRRRKTAGDNFISGLKDELATRNKPRSEVLTYEAQKLGKSVEAKPLIDQLKALEAAQHGAAEGFSKLNLSSVGARRELLVLAHELSQGNFKQFGGSLLVFGERIDATSLIMSAAGLATIGFTAVLVGLGVVLAAGAIEQDHFNKAIFLTGNAAGQTAASFGQMADRIKESSGATIGNTKGILLSLIETGRLGPRSLEAVGTAAANLQRVTGKSADDIAKEFEGITKSVSGWAEKINEKYNFLSAAQLSYIRDLENQHRAEEALIYGAHALEDHLRKQRENVGFLTFAWRGLVGAVSDAKNAVLDYGKTESPGEEIARLNKEIKEISEAKARRKEIYNPPENSFLGGVKIYGQGIKDTITAPFSSDSDAEVVDRIERIAKLRAKAAVEAANADRDARRVRREQEVAEAQKDIDAIEKSVRAGEEAERKIKIFRTGIAKIKEGGAGSYIESNDRELLEKKFTEVNGRKVDVIPDDATQREIERLIRQKDGTKAENELQNAIKATRKSIQEETAVLIDQIAQYEAYGKSVDKSREAKVRARLEKGDLKGAPLSVQEEFKAATKANDEREAITRQQKAKKATEEIISDLKAQAEAKIQNARESEITNKINQVDRTELEKTGETYAQATERIKQYVNAKHDNALVRQLKEDVAQTEYESKKLEEETDLIGKNTLERRQAVAVLKLEEEARKRLKDNPQSGEAIDQAKQTQIDVITASLERNYDAQRRFESGAKIMFSKYAEDAQNGADFAERVLGGGLKNVEDAFIEFTHTGKLSFKSLFQFMADEFTRQAVRINLKKLFEGEGGSGSAISSIGKFFGDLFGGSKGGSVVDPSGYGRSQIGVDQSTPQQIERGIISSGLTGATKTATDATASAAAAATSQAAATAATTLAEAEISAAASSDIVAESLISAAAGSDIAAESAIALGAGGDIGAESAIALGVGADLAAEAAIALAAALDIAATSAAAGGAGGIAGAAGGAGIGEFFDSIIGSLGFAAHGGIMSPRGMLPLQMYSMGGIADHAQLAVFGEGRKREAYIPMEDNQNVRVSVKQENGQVKAYAPLQGGRGIPVKLEGLDGLDTSRIGASPFPNSNTYEYAASGGVMSRHGMLPLQTYSLGGIADRAQLAVFGEGRKREAYIPMEDNKNVLVTVKQENGRIKAYAPLPDGRVIPVLLDGLGNIDPSIVSSTTSSTVNNLEFAASGGVMSPYGMLPLQTYSIGGIADHAQLAVFGEGRKREAYIPMEDNQNVRVSVAKENGQVKAYAPLPGGRGIPVTLDWSGLKEFLARQHKNVAQFAFGGIMSLKGPEELFGSSGIGGAASLFGGSNQIGGAASLFGSNQIGGAASLFGSDQIGGAADIFRGSTGGAADIFRDSTSGASDIFRDSISGAASLFGSNQIGGVSSLFGSSQIGGAASLFGSNQIGGATNLFGSNQVSGASDLFGSGETGGAAGLYPPNKIGGAASLLGPGQIGGATSLFGSDRVGGTISLYPPNQTSGSSDQIGEASSLYPPNEVGGGGFDQVEAPSLYRPNRIGGIAGLVAGLFGSAQIAKLFDSSQPSGQASGAASLYPPNLTGGAASLFGPNQVGGDASLFGPDQTGEAASLYPPNLTGGAASLFSTDQTGEAADLFSSAQGGAVSSYRPNQTGGAAGLFGFGQIGGAADISRGSLGGVADLPHVALFGEGRNREAYIPMEDNQNVRVTVKQESGQLKAYAPLPGGRAIPVTLDGLDRMDPTGAYMRLPNGKRVAAFEYGGIMSPHGVDEVLKGRPVTAFEYGGIMSSHGVEGLPIRAYADGGIAGGAYPLSNAVLGPYVPDRGPAAATAAPRGGNTYISTHDYAGVRVTPQEVTRPNGEKEIQIIIERAVQEVDKRILGGGSTGQILRSRGLGYQKALPQRS